MIEWDIGGLGPAAADAAAVLKEGLPEFTTSFKAPNSVNNYYEKTGNTGWTTGFLTGQYWLAYELTGEECFKRSASIQVDSFLKRIEQKTDVDHHDMGFLYSPSCVAAYKLTGSENGKRAAILAAEKLASRFRERGAFIQAWGELGARESSRMIIDCLMNLPLLHWASQMTGTDRYKEIADMHTETALTCLVRSDYSTYHTFYFDPETGRPLRGASHQGYDSESYWARGQAWAIYGIALAYRYTGRKEYIGIFEGVTDFFLGHLPDDGVPYWDLIFADGSGEPKDSSAAAIAVCGVLSMLEFLPEDKRQHYSREVSRMMTSLISDYRVKETAPGNGLLLHGVYGKKTPYNTLSQEKGVDECNCWGDYFYLEALTRLLTEWKPYW